MTHWPAGGTAILHPDDLPAFRRLVENQSVRHLRRQLEYGRRVRRQQGLAELYQWVGRILLDDGTTYHLEERAAAFEIAALERLAGLWPELCLSNPLAAIITGPVDRLLLYRQVLSDHYPLGVRAGLYQLLVSRYGQHGDWVRARAGSPDAAAALVDSGCDALLQRFLGALTAVEPLPEPLGATLGSPPRGEADGLHEELRQRQAETVELRRELEFAEDRAERAHRRLRRLEPELRQARQELREARQNEERWREERHTRIESLRQSTQSQRDLARLQADYARLEQRLQRMAARLAAAQHAVAPPAPAELRVTVAALRRLSPAQVLGLSEPVAADQLGRVRRRFAAVFHPDRATGLPGWVRRLCDEVLGVVNEACDRAASE